MFMSIYEDRILRQPRSRDRLRGPLLPGQTAGGSELGGDRPAFRHSPGAGADESVQTPGAHTGPEAWDVHAGEYPFPVAVKTGTSQGWRNAWAAVYAGDYMVGVWVGRPR